MKLVYLEQIIITENIDNVNTFMFVAAFQHGGTTIFAL